MRAWFLTALALGCAPASVGSDTPAEADDGTDGHSGTDGAGGDDGTGSTGPVDYGAPGPHPVGVEVLELTLRSGRTPGRVWYPATEAGSGHTYFDDGTTRFTGAATAGLPPDCSTARPLVVHSHGNLTFHQELYWLAEHLASHGGVVLAVDHPGNTWETPSPDVFGLLTQRPEDVADAYDALLGHVASSATGLDECLDPREGYLVSGYSFGGYTAYATGGGLVNDATLTPTYDLGDPDVRGVIAFAPWSAYRAMTTGTAFLDVPVLTLGAERDGIVFTEYEFLHGAVTSTPRVLGVFPEAGHATFMADYCEAWFNNVEGCGSGWVDREAFQRQAGGAVAAFVAALSGEPEALRTLESEDGVVEWTAVLE